MGFQIGNIAREYIYRRFPNASDREKQKYIRDWENKIKNSLSLVSDFESRVGKVRGKKIIDVGCGNGGVSIAFALSGASVTGVEIEKDLYEIAIEHSKNYNTDIDFRLYDGNVLPYGDETFDYAISSSVLEHTDDPTHYLSEILRVLKPDGCLYLGFPNKFAPIETHTRLVFLSYLPSSIQKIYIKLFGRNPLQDNNLHFYSFFDLNRMVTELNKATNAAYKYVIWEEKGKSKNYILNFIKKILATLGISYKVFLRHILVILQKKPKT